MATEFNTDTLALDVERLQTSIKYHDLFLGFVVVVGVSLSIYLINSIQDLKEGMSELNTRIAVMQIDIDLMKQDIVVIQQDIVVMKQDIEVMKQDIVVMKQDIEVMKQDIVVMKQDIEVMKQDIVVMKQDIDTLNRKMDGYHGPES